MTVSVRFFSIFIAEERSSKQRKRLLYSSAVVISNLMAWGLVAVVLILNLIGSASHNQVQKLQIINIDKQTNFSSKVTSLPDRTT